MGTRIDTYRNSYRPYTNFIRKYRTTINASTASEVDSNANVENKNCTTMTAELPKKIMIGINRLLMIDKLTELYGEELAAEYVRQLESHEIYRHDETSLLPYCVSTTMYPFLFSGMKSLGGRSSAPKHLESFAGSFVNMIYAIAAQFAGAVSSPEFITYLDYFIRKDYGDDYRFHMDDVMLNKVKPLKCKDIIDGVFQQIVYTLNEPAGARNFQSVFWNIAYFDRNYFNGIFHDFVFPDGTTPEWDSVNFLQKYFMNWFNNERLRSELTFPVETVNLLDNGKDYVDEEWKDFVAEMYAKKHSFFTYRSNSVDSLASCCFSPSTKVLAKYNGEVVTTPIKKLYDSASRSGDMKCEVLSNGKWEKAEIIKLPARTMHRVETANGKYAEMTDNHLVPTLRGDVPAAQLTTDDYILFNSKKLKKFKLEDKEFIAKYEKCIKAKNRWVMSGLDMLEDLDGALALAGRIATIFNYSQIWGDGKDDYKLQHYGKKELRSNARGSKIVNGKVYFRVTENKTLKSTKYKTVYCFQMENSKNPYFVLPNGMVTHNCRLRNEMQENTFSFTLGAGGVSTGSKGVMTININRLVQNAAKNGIDISEAVKEQVEKIHRYMIAYNEIVKENYAAGLLPVYNAGYISLNKQYLTIGINGFVEGAEFLGIEPTPNEKYYEYGERILKPIYTLNKAARTPEIMFNTEFVPAENLGVKNAKWDKEDGYVVPRDCYNSYFFRSEDENISIIDKFKLHGDRLTKYLDGGSALHMNLDEHLTKNQYLKLLDVAIKTGCSYFTFNVPNTICNECGHITKDRLPSCPKCNSKDIDYLTRIIGYLKRISAWSAPRQIEEEKRYYDKHATESI